MLAKLPHATGRPRPRVQSNPPYPERADSRLMLIVPLGQIGSTAPEAPGENLVNVIQTLVLLARYRSRLELDQRRLWKVDRVGRPEDPFFVDRANRVHANHPLLRNSNSKGPPTANRSENIKRLTRRQSESPERVIRRT